MAPPRMGPRRYKRGFDDDHVLTEQEAAALLKVTVKGVQGWLHRGGGPRYCKVGRLVRYRLEDLQAFVLAALRTSTSDQGPPVIPHHPVPGTSRRS